jgi:hypothetical protein
MYTDTKNHYIGNLPAYIKNTLKVYVKSTVEQPITKRLKDILKMITILFLSCVFKKY